MALIVEGLIAVIGGLATSQNVVLYEAVILQPVAGMLLVYGFAVIGPMRQAALTAWWPDPTGRHALRWHDGRRWTSSVSDGHTTGIDPVIE